MTFDADAEARALEVPAFRWQGVTYRGRILSEREIAPFMAFRDPDLSDDDRVQLEVRLWRLTFRRRWWEVWKRDPVKVLATMDWDVYQRFKADFFACLARRTRALSTTGTASPPRTEGVTAGVIE